MNKEASNERWNVSCDAAKEYTIPLRKMQQVVAVDKETFINYYQGINAFRRQEQRKGRCRCPKAKWLYCDMDCFECVYRVIIEKELDAPCYTEGGKTYRNVDLVSSTQESLEECILNEVEEQELVEMMKKLLPEWEVVEKMKDYGYTSCQIEKATGIKRTTYMYRYKKACDIIREKYLE